MKHQYLYLLDYKLHVNTVICRDYNRGKGFPGGSLVKTLPAKAEDPGSTPGLGRCP